MEFHGPYRSIIAEAIVPASPAEVWRAWTTETGLRTFFSPHVEMELRIGGPFHILFDMDQPPGLRGADDMRVMAYEPEKMLAFDWNAPPELPEIRPQRTHVTIYFEGASGGGTRVTLVHDGWGTGEGLGRQPLPTSRPPGRKLSFPVCAGDSRMARSIGTIAPISPALACSKGRLLQIFDREQRITQAYPRIERSVSNGVHSRPWRSRKIAALSHSAICPNAAWIGHR